MTTKDLSNSGILSPMVIFTLRAIGASTLFWILSLFMPREKVAPKDLLLIVAASILGLFIPQLTFLEASPITTAIDTSILGSITPIFTMFVAAIFLKEPLTWKKVLGVALSFAGVIFLILNSITLAHGASETKPLGVVLLIANTLSFALYLGIFRPLIEKYSVVTFMKWMFLVSLVVSLPFSARGLVSSQYGILTPKLWCELGFLVIFATFVAYFLIPYGQKILRPTVVSMYTYVQPVLAVFISIASGIDTLSWQKVVAMILIFSGVVIVNRSRAKV